MSNDERLIALTGLPGSGKTTLARVLAPELGLRVLDVADILREALPETARNLHRAEVGPGFIRLHGVAGVFDAVRDALRTDRDVMLDGLRLVETCQQLVSSYPGAQIWLIDASNDVRLRRLRARLGAEPHRADSAMAAYSAFDGELGGLRSLADVTLLNDGTPEDLVAAGRSAVARMRWPQRRGIK